MDKVAQRSDAATFPLRTSGAQEAHGRCAFAPQAPAALEVLDALGGSANTAAFTKALRRRVAGN